MYTIPTAAKIANVNPSSLLWAVNNGKLPSKPVNEGTDNEFKIVALEDVYEWDKRRSSSKSRGGRPKTKK